MKKTILLMLGLVATTASFAQQTTLQPPVASISQTRLIATTDQKIKLFVQPQPTKGQIILRDVQGHSLYTATVALQNGLGTQFDISDLAVGTYQLTVTTGTQTITKTFVVQPTPNQTFVVLAS
jgi:hypothetical protein